MNSRLYLGAVRHRRNLAPAHVFRYRLFMPYLDLDELPEILDPLWFFSARKSAPIRFRREDYLGSGSGSGSASKSSLSEAVRDRVEECLSDRPPGPIRLLAHLRYFGLCFNPVAFYYCFERPRPGAAAGTERLHSIVAEITNTPWLERHAYVLDCRSSTGDVHRFSFDKAFHISPFMPMDHRYRWRLTTPAKSLRVSMRSQSTDKAADKAAGGAAAGTLFSATLDMRARPFESRVLAGALLRHPWMSATVIGGIYWQALRLAIKGARFHAHPKHALSAGGSAGGPSATPSPDASPPPRIEALVDGPPVDGPPVDGPPDSSGKEG